MEAGLGTYGEQLLAVLSAASDELGELPAAAGRLTGADLDAVLPVIDRLAALAQAARFTIASEADQRGEVDASTAGTVRQWLAERCPGLDDREAGVVAKAVRELTHPDLEVARTAVAAGRLSVPGGVVVVSEWRQLKPLLQPGVEDTVLAGLVAVGCTHGCAGVRGLRTAMLSRFGLGERLQDEDDRRAGLTSLTCGHDIGGGISEYRMRLTPESRAVVEAAINTLAGPAVTEGVRDTRSVEQRRGDALVEVCRRATTLTSTATPAGVKTTVLVTISLDDLRGRTRAGTLFGGLGTGDILGPETVRRLACDAGIVPVVLNQTGQVMALGRTERAFTRKQTLALWLRDRHCTYPGCRIPASWTDAHHLTHWVDGGPTDLSNGTLLCERHHTVVHRHRLHGIVNDTGRVEWDRLPGSYDRSHAREPPADADPDPPPDP